MQIIPILIVQLPMFSMVGTGQTYTEDAKLLPNDGVANSEYGYAVATYDSIALVGSPKDIANGIESGSVYVYDTYSGQQMFKIWPNDGADNDRFGRSVAISGSTAVIGSIFDDDNGGASGSAYLFDITTGNQIAKLLPSDGSRQSFFGNAVAIHGTTVVIGAQGDDENGFLSGSAYVFDTTTQSQFLKLVPNDGSSDEYFGRSVAVNDSFIVVGAYRDSENGTFSGSAYLFDSKTGHQINKVLPDDGEPGDRFGSSVAISDNTIAVGCPWDNENGGNSGSVYLFDTITGDQIAHLLPKDGTAYAQFGNSVAINGNRIIVGAFNDDDNGFRSGSSYLFDLNTGEQIAKLLPSDGEEVQEFGNSVSIHNDAAIVGTSPNSATSDNPGAAYLFTMNNMCPTDITHDGNLNYLDISALLHAFRSLDQTADINNDGFIDFADIVYFLDSYSAGCP